MLTDIETLKSIIGEKSKYMLRLSLLEEKEDIVFEIKTTDSGVYAEYYDNKSEEMISIPLEYEYERIAD